jgi:glycosyltransferase involved in cell wall biosynthesis
VDISVICPVYDTSAAWLGAAVQSARVACQHAGLRAEIILVDDGSAAPGTLRMLHRLETAGARVVRPGGNAGPASARNAGIDVATGRWVGFLDADDLWLPDRFALARPLMARPGVGWIGGRHRYLDGPSRPGIATALGLAPDGEAAGPALTRCLIANFWMHLGAMLVRRDLLMRAGGFSPGLFYYEDFLLMTRLSLLAPLHLIDAETYAWRRDGVGLTASPRRLSRDTLRMHARAAALPALRPFRRELRWARYSALKGLALNNLLAGRRLAAISLALEAWAMDPREIGDLLRLIGLVAVGAGAARGRARDYSGAEIFIQDPAA